MEVRKIMIKRILILMIICLVLFLSPIDADDLSGSKAFKVSVDPYTGKIISAGKAFDGQKKYLPSTGQDDRKDIQNRHYTVTRNSDGSEMISFPNGYLIEEKVRISEQGSLAK